jgi:hypothetical protein
MRKRAALTGGRARSNQPTTRGRVRLSVTSNGEGPCGYFGSRRDSTSVVELRQSGNPILNILRHEKFTRQYIVIARRIPHMRIYRERKG